MDRLGYAVLRFSEAEVVYRLDEVTEKICFAVESIEKVNSEISDLQLTKSCNSTELFLLIP